MRKILFISMCMPFKKAFHAGGKTFNYYINKFANDSANEVTLIAKVLPEEEEYIKEVNSNIDIYPFAAYSLYKISCERIYIDPSFLNTTNTVLNRIFISSPMFQFVIYSLSRRTTSSKSVISLRPLTCHMPVIPGLIASLARW